MKWNDRSQLACIGLGALLATACGGSAGSASNLSSQMRIVEASNGFGRMLPYQIPKRDSAGNPTSTVIEIRSLDDLRDNVTSANPVLPPTEWPVAAVLPNNLPGNHFFYVRFTQEIDVDSVLGNDPTGPIFAGAIQVSSYNPSDQSLAPLKGRGFIGGRSYGPTLDPNDPTHFKLEQWVTRDGNGDLHAELIDGFPLGLGFPGTEGGFAGDDILVDPKTYVFVVDSDGDLTTHEAFPAGFQVQMVINTDVLSVSGRGLAEVGFASSTVGPDATPPEVLGSATNLEPVIVPGVDAIDVDPETNIEIQFTEPMQILSIGELESSTPPGLSAGIRLEFGPLAARVQVPFFVRPTSPFDLSRIELVPAYNFPGSGPQVGGLSCGSFGVVSITVNTQQLTDLSAMRNTLGLSQSFTTREGPGVVNAPVVPDAIYLGRAGSSPGLSVIDLYGFGQSTGNPTYDSLDPIREGNSNFPNNPNVRVSGSTLIPPLSEGTCTVNGGSEGVFTLTKDSSLNSILAGSPLIESVGDVAIGHALDNTFNNAAPFGCQAGGGNICATTGLKRALLAAGGPNSLAPSTTSTLPVKIVSGGENLISFAPAPNPPPLVFPPLCLSPLIGGQEPTSTNTVVINGQTNLLVPGANSRGNPVTRQPPTNLLVASQNSFFDGPSPPQPSVTQCQQFISRQQIGHFLYVLDRVAGEVVVLNSNRFTVIDRIRTPDPTSFAMSPNLDLLAVTNESADQVSFINTDPSSANFHRVVRTVTVGAGPTGIAWEPGNEDIFVCNQADGSISILSAFSLRPRKTIRNQITTPIDVALTPRQLGFGFLRGVYFAYILNQNGDVAVFESGPDGLNGWGFDDTIGTLPFRFFKPKAIQPDMQRLNSAVWIAHENKLGVDGNPTGDVGGALSNVGISSGTRAIIPLSNGAVANPGFRNLGFSVFTSIGEGSNGLSGAPVDIAFDNMLNLTALTNYSTQYSAGQPLSTNGRSSVRFNGNYAPTAAPQFMFLAVPNPGVVDVLELKSGTLKRVDTNVFQPGTQSIIAPNVSVLADFFRQ